MKMPTMAGRARIMLPSPGHVVAGLARSMNARTVG
jgi:hypothetical protein